MNVINLNGLRTPKTFTKTKKGSILRKILKYEDEYHLPAKILKLEDEHPLFQHDINPKVPKRFVHFHKNSLRTQGTKTKKNYGVTL